MFPVSIADEHERSRTLIIVGRVQIATNDRLNAESAEELGRDVRDHRARWPRTAGHSRGVGRVLCDRLEAMALVAKIIEIRIRKPAMSAVGLDFEHGHNAVWIGIRQSFQQDAI